ncbi:MAG: SpoIVB peptidase [Peptococcaceae bacterium]|nr:SpoIVB peptidase [Peptococcaceae bacterium]
MVVHTRRLRRISGLLLVAAIIGIANTAAVQGIMQIPAHEQLAVGDVLQLPKRIPQYLSQNIKVVADRQQLLRQSQVASINGSADTGPAEFAQAAPAYPVLAGTGHLQVHYLLFGLIPLKTVDVDVVPQVKLIPGGQSIGVMLQSQGVIVVGQSPIIDAQGKKCYPAKDAGIRLGDLILQIDGKQVKTDSDVAQAVDRAGASQKPIQVMLKRGQLLENKIIKPIYCPDTQRYRIGLYVRDSAAGVGTLTFYDPVSGKYGALGHIINDADTNQKIEIAQGKVIAAAIQSIQPGRRGQPGEKIGSFVQGSPYTGTIEKNTKCGIFGTIEGYLANPLYAQPLPIAAESQVKTGAAKILTVVKGEKIEAFDINIERLLPGRVDSKSMVIRITDPGLLAQSGGIVQGMSGSPILQDGRIVGAVTHVFVNDPTRGYGVFIEQMLKEANIPPNDKQRHAA